MFYVPGLVDSHVRTSFKNRHLTVSSSWWTSDQDLPLNSRNESRLWTPRVTEDGRAHPFKINLEAEQQVCETVCLVAMMPQIFVSCYCFSSVLASFFSYQEYKPIGTAHNRRAQPFVAAANIDDKRQVVSTSYNTPIGLYSSGNIQDAMEGQIRGLVQHKPERWSVQIIISFSKSTTLHKLSAKNLLLRSTFLSVIVLVCSEI